MIIAEVKRVSEPLRICRAEMPQNRTSKPSGRIKWTDTMIEDLYECRRRAFEISSSDGGSNGERIGYMKIMKQLWEEKGYYALGLTAQNLRDTVARYDKKKKPSERSYVDASKEKNQIGTNIEQENGESIHPVVDEEICISNNSRENLESSQLDHEWTPNRSINHTEVNEAINSNGNNEFIDNNELNDMHEYEYNFKWNEVNGADFCSMINAAYEEIIYWKRNIFLLPSGKVGKLFVQELARLYQLYADASPLENIALKACSVMQSLLLQKPFVKSKTKDHCSCLDRRLKQWLEGDIKALLSEGKCIQRHLTSQTYKSLEFEKITRGFNRLMLQGKVHQAVRLISNVEKSGLLSLDDMVPDVDANGNATWKTAKDILLEKHPAGKIPPPEVLLPDTDVDPTCFDPIIFERITGESIKEAAMKTNGAAGPSGVDAYGL